MLQIDIPGLCYASSLDPRANQIGYINFIRETDKNSSTIPSELNFNVYRRDILPKQAIDEIIKEKYEHSPEAEVSDEHTAVLWINGAVSQLKCVCDKRQLEIEAAEKIVSNKQSVSRKAVE